jgi:hypothetical protein
MCTLISRAGRPGHRCIPRHGLAIGQLHTMLRCVGVCSGQHAEGARGPHCTALSVPVVDQFGEGPGHPSRVGLTWSYGLVAFVGKLCVLQDTPMRLTVCGL